MLQLLFRRWFCRIALALSGLLVASLPAQAQKEATIWHFGRNAGFDFSQGSPRLLEQNGMMGGYATAVMSDRQTGELLFYSDAESVWNRQHQLMPNGQGLRGTSGLTQSVLTIPVPGQTQQYYLFTLQGGVYTVAALSYSRLDMRLNAGLGDVVASEKNQPLAGAFNHQVTAIPHVNGQDYWLLTRRWNSNIFPIYLVNQQGITLVHTPALGPAQIADLGNVAGYLKASPDGKKLAYMAAGRFSMSLFDFNATTGTLRNYVNLGPSLEASSVSFSPDNSKLYVSHFDVVDQARGLRAILSQFDLLAGDAAAIAASRMSIVADNPTTNIQANQLSVASDYTLQLGLDGRLYGNSGYEDQFLPQRVGQRYMYVINYPNRRGFACQVRAQPFVFANPEASPSPGLPNFIQSYFNGLEPSIDEAGACGDFALTVFPNPTRRFVQVQVPRACFAPYELTLYDALGQRLSQMTVSTALSLPLDLGARAAGLYLLQARRAGQVVTKRLVLK